MPVGNISSPVGDIPVPNEAVARELLHLLKAIPGGIVPTERTRRRAQTMVPGLAITYTGSCGKAYGHCSGGIPAWVIPAAIGGLLAISVLLYLLRRLTDLWSTSEKKLNAQSRDIKSASNYDPSHTNDAP